MEEDMEITPEKIENIVSEHFEMPIKKLYVKSRERKLVFPRQLIAYFLRKYTICSLEDIGSRQGGRNHATAVYSCRTIRNLMETDRKTRKIVRKLDSEISSYAIPNLMLRHLQKAKQGDVLNLLRGNEGTIPFQYKFSHIRGTKIYGAVKTKGQKWSSVDNFIKMAEDIYYQKGDSDPEIIYFNNQKLKK